MEQAADLLWRAAADGPLNSDFNQSDVYWHHWRPYPGKSLSHHINWQQHRQKLVTLDDQMKKVGERSLRLNLNQDSFQRTISVDSNRFRLPPGEHRLSGWIRWDEGAELPKIRLQYRNLAGDHDNIDIQLRKQGQPTVDNNASIRLNNVEISSPDENGWRQLTADIATDRRHVVNFLITGELAKGAKSGHVWFDDFRVEPR